MPVTTKFIDGAWLVYTPEEGEDVVRLPLTEFQVTYRIGGIPYAQVRPSIGFNLKTPKQVTSVTGLKERLQVRIDFSQDKEVITLMEGFVETISLSETSSTFSRKATVMVSVKHNVVRLAGAPPVSFRYTADNAVNLQTLYGLNKTQLLVLPGDDSAATDLNPVSSFIQIFHNTLGIAVSDYPSHILRGVADFIAEEWNLKKGMLVPEDLVRSYGGANITNLGISNIPVMQYIASTFSKQFPTTNTWEALRHTAKSMFMDIIPFNRGVYVANNSSLIRDPDVVLEASEYVTLQDSQHLRTGEPVDGVAVLNPVARAGIPGVNSVLATWPAIGDEGEADDIVDAGKYYHFREFPQWLLSLRAALHGPPAGGTVNEETPGAVEDAADPKAKISDEAYQDLATRVAKALYAEARMGKRMLSVTTPFRTDLMPGTSVAIKKPTHREDFFATEDVYGHIKETVFAGSLLGAKGTVTVSIKIGSVRTKTDNEDMNLTFETHPLYQAKWVGIDLFGNPVAPDVPFDELEAPPTKKNNAVTGKKISTGISDTAFALQSASTQASGTSNSTF